MPDDDKFIDLMKHCTICPHKCGVNRTAGEKGFCNTDGGLHVSSVFAHKGEEPVISGLSGICNIFFSHCNLQCIYCQNHQISNNSEIVINEITNYKVLLDNVLKLLDNGCLAVGFVSPSHFFPIIIKIINEIHKSGRRPIIVYNSNGYDNIELLKTAESLIDIYLPDFKYIDNSIAKKYSGIDNYFEHASGAIKEMYRQKGSTLRFRNKHQAESGLIIRHLVLPGHIDNSKSILEWISEELSSSVHISLMSQYYPTYSAKEHKVLGRSLYHKEYQSVINKMETLGFSKGWIQDIESSKLYRPDFSDKTPFAQN